jgi:hypothetical protein
MTTVRAAMNGTVSMSEIEPESTRRTMSTSALWPLPLSDTRSSSAPMPPATIRLSR